MISLDGNLDLNDAEASTGISQGIGHHKQSPEDFLERNALEICGSAFTASSDPVIVNAFGPMVYCELRSLTLAKGLTDRRQQVANIAASRLIEMSSFVDFWVARAQRVGRSNESFDS